MGVIEVAIGRGTVPETFRVEVTRSPAGDASAVTHLDVSSLVARRAELQNAVLASAVSTRRALEAAEECLRGVGEALFTALLGSSELSGRYRASTALMADRDDELRVVLRIDDPALAALPWEAMYDKSEGGYVCRLRPLVRHVPVAAAAAPLAADPPLRILAIASSPRGLPTLDVDKEKENLSRALDYVSRVGLIEVEWASSARWPDLQDTLLGGRWHVVHFIGHGDFDPVRDEGVIALEGEDGRGDLIEANRFVDLLHQARPAPRLVVLNSCSGAVSGTSDIFSGTAAALARRGVGAVVAMQYEISDMAAVAFCRGFYGAVARGRSIDDAVTSGRVAIVGLNGRTLEWITPVLYLRGHDGHLFALPSVPRSPGSESQTGGGSKQLQGRGGMRYGQPRLAVVTILYLAVNPADLPRSDSELTVIRGVIRSSRERDRFRLVSAFVTHAQDIAKALVDNNPQIVHLAGHADQRGLIIEGEGGYSTRVTVEGVVGLLGLVAGSVSCVILSASHTAEMAREIARHVDYVVGMSEVDSISTIAFSDGFYQALAAGQSIPDAFSLGIASLRVTQASKRQLPVMFTDET